MKTGEKETQPRYGTVNFERRKYPRFNVNLPIEYYRIDSSISHTGKALNISEGGLLIYFPEEMEIGQHLKLKLFLASASEMKTIEPLVEVVWIDFHLGTDWEDYRTGVMFVNISTGDMEKLKNFLANLSQ